MEFSHSFGPGSTSMHEPNLASRLHCMQSEVQTLRFEVNQLRHEIEFLVLKPSQKRKGISCQNNKVRSKKCKPTTSPPMSPPIEFVKAQVEQPKLLDANPPLVAKDNIICYNCQRQGHFARECPLKVLAPPRTIGKKKNATMRSTQEQQQPVMEIHATMENRGAHFQSSLVHVPDLPGFTRSVYERDHALITPESHVFSTLPDWTKTSGAYLTTPAMGSHFVMYLAQMEENSTSALPPKDVERFLFVVKGEVVLSADSEAIHKLPVDSFAYAPANFKHSLKCDTLATIIIFERRYHKLENEEPKFLVGSTDKQPLLETPGEVFALRKLLPTTLAYDFNVHVMDFDPGEYLNVKEVHYNQHGLLLLEGRGIYRLGDHWYSVQAGDAIWMAPFVPQWYAALGKTRSRYLLYKDVNRNPLL